MDRQTVLEVHLINETMMSVGDNENQQTERQICSSQKAEVQIKGAQIKWDIKVLGSMYSIQQWCQLVTKTDIQSEWHTVPKRCKLI